MDIKSGIKNFILFGSTIAIIGSGISFGLDKCSSEGDLVSTACYTDYDDFDIGAHRGFSSLAVENTVSSFEMAQNASYVDYIEMDARLTGDGEIVLSHNDDVYNLFQSDKISEMTSDDLNTRSFSYIADDIGTFFGTLFDEEGRTIRRRMYDLNGSVYEIASLDEGIEACGDKKILMDLKFKDNTEAFVEALEAYFSRKDTSNIIFQSDDVEALLYLKSQHPEYICVILVRSEEQFELIDQFDGIGIRKNVIDKDFVVEAVEDEKLVLVWTLKSSSEVDGVASELEEYCDDVVYITDYPDLVHKHLVKNYSKK